MPPLKLCLPVLLGAFLLAGCASDKQQAFPTTNPIEKQCQAEGVQAGKAMTDCMRQKAALGIARNTCAGKRLNLSSPAGQTCVKMESDFTIASSQCESQGLGTESPDRIAEFKSCIRAKAPEAADYEFGKGG